MWTLGVTAAESVPFPADSATFGHSEALEAPEALVSLAARYEHAEGVERDYAKAVGLYCRAAKDGHAGALYSLGWMYANGRGVERDDGVAQRLFQWAAAQGHPHAERLLQYVKTASIAQLPPCLLPDPEPPATNAPAIALDTVFPKGPILELVKRLAPRYEVDPGLVLAVISVESGFNVKAISPRNAQGLMQLMPDTARRFGVRNTFDPEENIRGGMKYLQWLLAYFKGNIPLVAAAYNAGERAVEAYRGIPPYPETRDYVRKITSLYQKAVHPYQSHMIGASPVTMR
jgi:soluble lytic murein transglycosylase-like protein